jgi:hypothetical protein
LDSAPGLWWRRASSLLGYRHPGSPWLAGSVGIAHRAHPKADLEDLVVTVVLALITPESQHIYLQITRNFRPDSLGLDHIIEEVRAEIDLQPGIIAHFLEACKETGVPR